MSRTRDPSPARLVSSTGATPAVRNSRVRQAKDSEKLRKESDAATQKALQPVVAPSPCQLPVEVLIEAFSYLFTTDVVQCAQVSRTWRAASNSVSVRSSITFPHTGSGSNGSRRRFRNLVAGMLTNWRDEVESIDFAHLSSTELCFLVCVLSERVSSVKRIVWIVPDPGGRELMHLLSLARGMKQLEMLDLRRRHRDGPSRFDRLVAKSHSARLIQQATAFGSAALGKAALAFDAQPCSLPKLTLSISSDFADRFLLSVRLHESWLSQHHISQINLELGACYLSPLVCLIVARQAGARGASRTQYYSLLRDSDTLLNDIDVPHRAALDDLLARAQVMVASSDAPPLCPEVVWKLLAPRDLSPAVKEWLKKQPNVLLRLEPA